MTNNSKAWSDQAAALISRSDMFEASAPSGAQAIHELMGSLASVTASSFKKPETALPAQAAPLAKPAFSASKKEYQPALQDRTLANALVQLQQMRQNNRANVAPRIVNTQFRQEEFIRVDLHTPARVHPPKK